MGLIFALLVTFGLPASAQSSTSDASTVLDYVPTYTNEQPRARVRWIGTQCVRLQPHSRGSEDISDGSELEAIQRAVDGWTEATKSCSYFHIDVLPPSEEIEPGYKRRQGSLNGVFWVESGWASLGGAGDPAHPPSMAAPGITTVFFVDDPQRFDHGRILHADIFLNGEHFSFATDGSSAAEDVQNVVTHELGHLMGLDHTCDDGARSPLPLDNNGNPIPSCFGGGLSSAVIDATMYNFTTLGETSKRSPEAGDILGICETYPLAEDPGHCGPTTAGGGCGIAEGARDTSSWPIALLVWLLGCALGRRRDSNEKMA